MQTLGDRRERVPAETKKEEPNVETPQPQQPVQTDVFDESIVLG